MQVSIAVKSIVLLFALLLNDKSLITCTLCVTSAVNGETLRFGISS